MARIFFRKPKGLAAWFKPGIYCWREAIGWASAMTIVASLTSIALAATAVDIWW